MNNYIYIWIITLAIMVSVPVSPANAGDVIVPFDEALEQECQKHVEMVLRGCCFEKSTTIEQELFYFSALDKILKKNEGHITGITDNVMDLLSLVQKKHNQSEEIPYCSTVQRFAKPDKDLTSVIKFHAKQDRDQQIRSLSFEDRYNRLVRLVNSLSRSTVLALSGNIPPLVNSLSNLAVSGGDLTGLSIQERKLLRLYQENMKDGKAIEGAEKIKKKMQRIQKKKHKAAYKAWVAEAVSFEKQGDTQQALHYWRLAAKTGIKEDKVRRKVEEAEELLNKRDARRRLTLFRKTQHLAGSSAGEQNAYEKMVRLLALGEEEMLNSFLSVFVCTYPESSLVDDAYFLSSCIADARRDHPRAKSVLRMIVKEYPDGNIRPKAEWLLNNEDYNVLQAIDRAKKGLRKRRLQYILFGKKFVRNNAMFGKGRVIQGSNNVLSTLGVLNLFGVVGRTVGVMRGRSVSMAPVIDVAERYLIMYPHSGKTQEIYELLAKAYYKERRYDKALQYYKKCDKAPKKRVKSLQNKIAYQWYHYALTRSDESEKIYLLEYVKDSFPDTKVIPKVTDSLDALKQKRSRVLTVKRDWIRDNFERFQDVVDALRQEWVDGKKKNKEFREDAIIVKKDRVVTLNLADTQGDCPLTVSLSEEKLAALTLLVARAQYQDIIRKGQSKRSPLPVALFGSVGSGGLELYPKLNFKKYDNQDAYLYR